MLIKLKWLILIEFVIITCHEIVKETEEDESIIVEGNI